MFSIAKWSLVALLTTATLLEAREARVLRPTGIGHAKSAAQPRIAGADEDYLISYEGEDLLNFLTIPNDFGDTWYNVRFTPPVAPFYLLEANIVVFDMDGAAGTPGMRVLIWQDGEDGLPDALIDHIDVAPEDMILSSADNIVYNVVDLRPLEISFGDATDFHIGVDVIADDESDTLAVLIDDADGHGEDRSSFLNGVSGEWTTLEEDYLDPYCFAIRALVTDQNPFIKGALAGWVSDLATGEPISGATIATSRGDSTASDSSGAFIFRRISVADNYMLTVFAEGYNDLVYAGENGDGFSIVEDETLWVDLSMTRPVFEVDHDGFQLSVPQDSTYTESFTIANRGNGPLWYRSGFAFLDSGRTARQSAEWRQMQAWNLSGQVDDQYLSGVEFVGGYWYVTGDANLTDDNWFYRFDAAGQYVDRIAQPVRGRHGIGDMKYLDGSLYCTNNVDHLLKVNPETGELISTVALPHGYNYISSIAIDPSAGEFYLSGFESGVHRLRWADGESLSEVQSYTLTNPSTIDGLAWQADEPDGFNLIMTSPDHLPGDSAAGNVSFYKLNPNTGEVKWLAEAPRLGASDYAQDGLCVTDRWDHNRVTLAAMVHNPSGDRIELLEVAPNSGWLRYTPQADTIAVNGSVQIDLTVDCAGLDTGYYSLAIEIKHNAAGGVAFLPVELTVTSNLSAPPDFSHQPSAFSLIVYPNPFNSSTTIRFNLPVPGPVHLEVYDPMGRRVRELMGGEWMGRGEQRVVLDGSILPSGSYVIRLSNKEAAISLPTQQIK